MVSHHQSMPPLTLFNIAITAQGSRPAPSRNGACDSRLPRNTIKAIVEPGGAAVVEGDEDFAVGGAAA